MIDKGADKIIGWLIKNDLMEEKERELYRFGFKHVFLCCINLGTAIIIGAICGMFWQSIVFSMSYIPLRRYAGGYHAKTPQLCYILSTLLIFSALMVVKYFPNNNFIVQITVGISALLIFLDAPIESKNKPLNEKETVVFRKKARILFCINIILVAITMPISREFANCITVAIVCCALMLFIARIQNILGEKKGQGI